MAQEQSKARRWLRRLALRYGLRGRVAVAVAVVVLVMVVGAVAVALAGGLPEGMLGEVVIARADDEEAADDETNGEDSEDAETADGETDGDSSEAGDGSDDSAEDGAEDDDADAGTIVVHVDGAVVSPGVYELPAGSRANDAVEAAGGLLAEADTSGINLAAELSDGEKLYVPAEGEDTSDVVTGTTSATGSSSSGSGSSSDSDSDSGSDGLININTATEEELCELPGIGEVTAANIVADREANGDFTSIEDIMRVSGIGEAKFAAIEDLICV